MAEEFKIKDSGERKQFESGMVRDITEGKTDYTLIMDGPMFDRWAVHLTKGAKKYAKRNWMKANGDADNHVMLIEDNRYGFFSTKSPVVREALADMDAWLTRIVADTSAAALAVKVRRNRPSDVTDACWTRDQTPQKLVERQERSAGRCAALYPPAPAPREVAGASVAADVIKCQLKPVALTDYKASFTADEQARLRRTFAGGVCDWSRPGVEQQKLAGTWQTFGAAISKATTP